MLCCTCVHTQQWCHSVLTHLWIHFSHISWCQLLFKWLLNLRQDGYFEWHHYTKFNCICLKSKLQDVKKNLKLITELKCLVVLLVKFKNVAAIEYLIMLDEQKHCWVTCDSYFRLFWDSNSVRSTYETSVSMTTQSNVYNGFLHHPKGMMLKWMFFCPSHIYGHGQWNV